MTGSGRNIRIDRIFPTSGTLEVDGKLDFTNSLGIGTELPQANLHVVGNTYVSSNLEVGQANLFVDTTSSKIGVGTATPQATLHVDGNAYVSSNLEVGQANLFVDTTSSKIGVGTTEPDATLHVDGNTYVSSNLEVGQANLFVDTTSSKIGVGTTEPDATLHVDGNAYVSSNLEVGQANLFVDTTSSRVGVGTATPQANLHVEGNAYVSSNLEVSGNVRITDGLSNVCELSTFGIPSWDETGYQKIEASDAGTSDDFGGDVAISGNYAIVGAPAHDDSVNNIFGAAYIYKRNTSTGQWGDEVKIQATDGTGLGNTFFGLRVAISGNYAIVGAKRDDQDGSNAGAAYIFKKDTTTDTWDGGTKIRPGTNASAGRGFGGDVDIDGEYAVVASNATNVLGSVYIFKRDTITDTWSQQAEIRPSEVHQYDLFAYKVAISGDYVIAGAPYDDDQGENYGAAYIFRRNPTTDVWDDSSGIYGYAKIVAPAAISGASPRFGTGVAISGNYAMVGAPYDHPVNFVDAGSVHIFKRDTTATNLNTWDSGYRIISPKTSIGSPGTRFGDFNSISISGDAAVVSPRRQAGFGYDIFYFKRIDTNTWDTGTEILTQVPTNNSGYGYTHHHDGNHLIIGASSLMNDNGDRTGAAFIHTRADVARLNIPEPIVTRSGTVLSFTGQHICFPEGPMNEGLVVSANKNKYVSLNGSLTTGSHAIKSSEALPIVSLSNVANDRSVFGVVDHFEMGGNTRSQKSGIGIITQDKEIGDNRVIVNSLGEGGIWVADTNGNVASGDFMTTSHLPGYAQRQDDDILRNSTVAKSTMECDFNPLDIPVQKIKKDENGTNILDTYGRLQWEDTDRTEKAYRVRYLTSEGELTDEANAVHTAAFIGCTYHCG